MDDVLELPEASGDSTLSVVRSEARFRVTLRSRGLSRRTVKRFAGQVGLWCLCELSQLQMLSIPATLPGVTWRR